MKYIVVKGCSFSLSVGTGTVNATSAASTKVKFGGKYAYLSPLTISVSNYTDDSSIFEGAGVGVITGSSSKVKIENRPAILEGDSVDVLVNGVASNGYTPTSTTVTVKIQKAGQEKGTCV